MTIELRLFAHFRFMKKLGYQETKQTWMSRLNTVIFELIIPASMMSFTKKNWDIENVCFLNFVLWCFFLLLCNQLIASFILADSKTIYLLMYNFYQFIGYFYIVLVLSISLSRDGFTEVSKITYKTVGAAMRCSQTLQYLEFLNALVGYTKGSPLFPFLQVTGRNFILFAIIHAETRIQEMPVVFALFMVWSLVELVRYPYYIIAILKKDIPTLTWLRYSIWIVLYPLGVLCEGTILLRSLPLFEETKRFTISLPNKWNFAFDMVSFMKIYMGFVLLPGLYVVMKHMTKLRANKLKKPTIHRINHKNILHFD